MEKRKPETHINFGGVEAAIWKNQGKTGDFFAVTFSRSYRDENGDWKESTSYGLRDILSLLVVAGEALRWIRAQQGELDNAA